MHPTPRLSVLLALLSTAASLIAQPDRWHALHNRGAGASMPVGRSSPATFVIGTKAYICGGGNLSDLWAFDQVTGLWTQMASIPTDGTPFLNALRSQASGFAIGSSGFVACGGVSLSDNYSNDLWEYESTTNTWIERASVPGPERSSAVGFAINGKGYVGLGNSPSNGELNDLWQYDPGTGTWIAMPDLPAAGRTRTTAGVINDKAYIAGGLGGVGVDELDELWRFDPSGPSWVALAPMVSPRFGAMIFPLNDLLYVCMGYNESYVNDVTIYDPASDSWSAGPIMPGGQRQDGCAFAIGTKGYAGMGYGNVINGGSYNDFLAFDGSWTLLSNTDPKSIQSAVSFSLNGKGYVVGGINPLGAYSAECWEYDPVTDVWTQKADFADGGRGSAVAFSIGNTGYVATGAKLAVTPYQNDLWAFDPVQNTWTPRAPLPTAGRHDAYAFALNNKGYIGGGLNAGSQEMNDLWQYDPVNNTWSSRTALTNNTLNAVAFTIGKYGYVVSSGGQTRAYDPDVDAWTNKQQLFRAFPNISRDHAVAFTAGQRGYVCTGQFANQYYDDVWEYGPAQDTWTQRTSFPGMRRGKATAFSIADKGYLVGGNVDAFATAFDDVWSYEPPEDQTCNVPTPLFCFGFPGNYAIANVLGYRAPDNIYTAEISDLNGDFSSPTTIGTQAGTGTAVIECTVPLGLPAGTGYRIRVRSSDPVYVGPPNPFDVTLMNTTTYWHDADFDGYGDPADSVVECYGHPDHYVTNHTDDCPNTYGSMFQACNDLINTNYGDTINERCECRGGNIRYLVFRTDDHGDQITWELVRTGTNTVLLHGPATPYANNTDVTEILFIHDGCYELRVYDSGGDGIGNEGGYLLVDESGRAIIDNLHNGGFAALSTIGQHLGFCLPASPEGLDAASADRENWVPNNIITCTPDPLVSQQWGIGDQTDDGYQFWFFDPNGSYSRRVFRSHALSGSIVPANASRATKLQLNTIVSNPIPTDLLLNVRVRPVINGAYGEFGPASRFRMLSTASCPVTQLENEGPHFSCGGYRDLNGSAKVWAKVVTRPAAGGGTQVANKYQFEWSNADLGYQRLITSNNAALVLSVWATNPLITCHAYQVRVRASFDGGITYCPWGPACGDLYIYDGSCAPGGIRPNDGGVSADSDDRQADLLLFPNPNDGSRFAVVLRNAGIQAANVRIVVIDAVGREVLNTSVPTSMGMVQATMSFASRPAPGVYAVSIVADDRTFAQRLVVQ